MMPLKAFCSLLQFCFCGQGLIRLAVFETKTRNGLRATKLKWQLSKNCESNVKFGSQFFVWFLRCKRERAAKFFKPGTKTEAAKRRKKYRAESSSLFKPGTETETEERREKELRRIQAFQAVTTNEIQCIHARFTVHGQRLTVFYSVPQDAPMEYTKQTNKKRILY